MVQHERRGRREAADQTRAELLEAGAELLREQPVGDIFSQVKAADVARRAGGRSIGAVYHHWRDQDAYRQDLLAYICRPDHIPGLTDPWRHVEAVAAEAERLGRPLHMADAVRAGGNSIFGDMEGNPFVALQMAMWSKHTSDPLAEQLLADQLYRPADDRMAPVYDQGLAAAGRRVRPPLTVWNISTVITALADGLTLRQAVDPDSVPEDVGPVEGHPVEETPGGDAAGSGRWGLFAAAVYVVLMEMTEPIDPGGPTSPAADAGTSGG